MISLCLHYQLNKDHDVCDELRDIRIKVYDPNGYPRHDEINYD